MESIRIETPLSKGKIESLCVGQKVLISGVIYTARDQAHKRLFDLIKQGKELPFEVKDQIIYYVGPTPAPKDKVIGSAGPTTSGRMDQYTPMLIERGLKGMIGKGDRGQAVISSMKKMGAVYFAAIGGTGALISDCIIKCEVIAFGDLGSEAIHKLVVKDLPTIVAIDTTGNNLYEVGIYKYLNQSANS